MQLIIRKASVRCVAGLRRGCQRVTTDRGALVDASFSWAESRRKNSDTNPVELIAAAHASSFALALTDELGKPALRAGELLISASVSLQHLATGWTITNIHLTVVARLPHLSQSEFIDATVRAKTNCVVSRALRPSVSMTARLEKTTPTRSPWKTSQRAHQPASRRARNQ